MDRRNFIKQIGLSLAAGWAFGWLSAPWTAWAAAPDLRLAVLSDAHLKNGDDYCPTAQALAQAVGEINALSPPPDLVLFAGDLAHHGRPDAFDLGQEILSDLPAPLWAVRGEGDGGVGGLASWSQRFGAPRFSFNFKRVHFLGLDTVFRRTPYGPAFEIGAEQLSWLAGELAALDAATPLVIVSHAPLDRLFFPWQQWTQDAQEIKPLLARFRQVLCLHGHAHGAGVHGAKVGGRLSEAANGHGWPGFLTKNRQLPTASPLHLSVPATAWPLPAAVQGTPALMRPGLGPHGCGWSLVTWRAGAASFQPHLWHA
jgi:3',5'-cyclic-AMP phosphodiesterase